MSDYSFIDMHIHSKYSDEDFCDITVEEILQKAQTKAKQLGRPCAISIADHNSMLASKEAQILINTGKYPDVKFINGMEITVDMCEVNKKIGKNLFKRVHILAYNFSETNPELLAYSKITHIKFEGYDENVGLQICASRRAINEKYGITIPFKVLLPLVNLKRTGNVRGDFLDVVMPYLQSEGIKASRQEIKELIKPYVKNYVARVENAEVYGKLTISEASRLVKNAGGELVIAHPAKIHVCQDVANQILADNGMSQNTKKYDSKAINLETFGKKDIFLELLIESANEITQTKIKGIEAYNITALNNGTAFTVDRIAKKYGLYKTAGSDYHGDILTDDRSVGNVFIDEVHESVRNKYSKDKSDNEYIYVSSLPCIEYYMGKSLAEAGVELFITAAGKNLSLGEYKSLYEDVKNRKKKRHAERVAKSKDANKDEEDVKHKYKLKVRIGDLIKIVEETNFLVYNSNENPHRKFEKLIKLNKMAEKLYEGISKLVQEGSLDNETLNHIKKQILIIKKNLYEIASRYPKAIESYNKSIKNDKNIEADWLNSLINVKIGGK